MQKRRSELGEIVERMADKVTGLSGLGDFLYYSVWERETDIITRCVKFVNQEATALF